MSSSSDHDSGNQGYINKQYTVWCGKCGNWSQVSARRQARAEKLFRREGWSNTVERSWVCKPCQDGKVSNGG